MANAMTPNAPINKEEKRHCVSMNRLKEIRKNCYPLLETLQGSLGLKRASP